MVHKKETRVGFAAVHALTEILERELKLHYERVQDHPAMDDRKFQLDLLTKWDRARFYLDGIEMVPGSRPELLKYYK